MDQMDQEQFETGARLLQGLARDLAGETGITLSEIQFDDGRPLGCRDFHILTLGASGKSVSTKISHKAVEGFSGRDGTKLIRAKIGIAVKRLQIKISS